jgi:hypothetical protein
MPDKSISVMSRTIARRSVLSLWALLLTVCFVPFQAAAAPYVIPVALYDQAASEIHADEIQAGPAQAVSVTSSAPVKFLSGTRVRLSTGFHAHAGSSFQAGIVEVTAPAFTTQPTGQPVATGSTYTLSAVASGIPAPAYQWRKNGVNLSGATNASLTLANIQAGDAGSYDVVATNLCGTATSSVAVLTVHNPAIITSHPVGKTRFLGQSVSFYVTATGGAPLSYQWRKNGVDIAGATTAALTLANLAVADAGDYQVVVTNPAGSAMSTVAPLIVRNEAPIDAIEWGESTIDLPPDLKWNKKVAALRFRARVKNVGNTTWENYWTILRRSDATSPFEFWSTGLPSLAPGESGYVQCYIGSPLAVALGTHSMTLTATRSWNDLGTAFGQKIERDFTVVDPDAWNSTWLPFISSLPSLNGVVNQTVSYQATHNYKVDPGAGYQTPYGFHWVIEPPNNGYTFNKATGLLTVTPTATGRYIFLVYAVGPTMGNGAVYEVIFDVSDAQNPPPTITKQPVSLTVTNGYSTAFVVEATGPGTIQYQWQKNGVNIPYADNNFAITKNLVFHPVSTSDAGRYRVQIWNNNGAIFSNEVILTVTDQLAPPTVAAATAVTGTSFTANWGVVSAAGGYRLDVSTAENFSSFVTGFQSRDVGLANSFSVTGLSLNTTYYYRLRSYGTNPTIPHSGNSATISVTTVASTNTAPVITTHPASQTVDVGSSVTFGVAASGTPAPSYQWRKNGTAIAGATDSSYIIPGVVQADAGNYDVVATNSAGSATSSAAILTVNPPAPNGIQLRIHRPE